MLHIDCILKYILRYKNLKIVLKKYKENDIEIAKIYIKNVKNYFKNYVKMSFKIKMSSKMKYIQSLKCA